MSRPLLHGGANRWLALGAAALGLGALLAGEPRHRASVDVDELARAVQAERDHVAALELAGWIREGRSGVRVIDVRDSTSFEALHIPGARRMDVADLVHADFPRGDTLVLYSEGGIHAAQAWFFLRATGYRDVYFLRGGLFEWVSQVLEPALPSDATPAERAGFQRAAALSRYFGGLPRVGVPRAEIPDAFGVPGGSGALPGSGERSGTTVSAVRRIRRRSC